MSSGEMQYAPPFLNPALSPIRVLLSYANRPGTVSFAGGHPDVSLFNVDALREASEIVSSRLAGCLQYGETGGQPAMREAAANLSAGRGVKADPSSEVIITGGSQQALSLVAQVMLTVGDKVIVENPCFPSTDQALRHTGAQLIPVTSGASGIELEELEEAIRQHRPKMMCVVASFSNPSGSTLSAEKRKKLLGLALKYKVLLVEDDPYSDLRYAGEPVPPIAAFADEEERNWIVYLSSLSKTVAPALRIGWMVAPAELRRRCLVAKQADDLSTSPWTQEIAAEYLRAGAFHSHLPSLIKTYGHRCETMCSMITELSGGRLTFTKPEGGMFVWARLTGGRKAQDLLQHAIDQEVVFVPGNAFYPDPSKQDPSTLRMSFASVNSDLIIEGVKRLVKAIDILDAQ
ncbi:PLP-dependent aminotransferase family protein [Pantoea sp. Tr-811]|uniref:aminotransferase-like domain-containing protein n=1 Tax=Pantoea sp. Tr-811 TaxID=2608361 RepID=UPI001421D4A9|nr:PLP-dependent aminotransferase family protein [Pantoea sp. Tr-811]NIF30197.1 PLP-dependent aminotransferase family protein [Pantoea sp. Tr-811]